MNRLSINEMTTYRWPFEEDVEQYRRAEIPGIGVWRHKLSDFGEERAVELLADAGLEVSNLLWAGGFTGSDGRSFNESVDDAREAIRTTQALRAGCLVVYPGGRGGHTRGHAGRLIKDALDQLLPLAEQLRVTLAIEPMHANYAADWTFLTQSDDVVALINKYNSPWLRMVLDTYHQGHEPDAVERLRELAPLIAIVHLGDGRPSTGPEQERTCLGKGVMPIKEMVQALEAAGYRGYYDLELIGQDIETECYHRIIHQSKLAVERMFQEVAV